MVILSEYFIREKFDIIMIKAVCITKLEGYECPVTKFAYPPQIGDKVKVRKGGKIEYLTILEVSHSTNEMSGNPEIIVELGNERKILKG